MLPPLVAVSAMPLAQSCAEPPPSEITQSQFSCLSSASPSSTFLIVGFGFAPGNTTLVTLRSISIEAIWSATPSLCSTLSVTISARLKPRALA